MMRLVTKMDMEILLVILSCHNQDRPQNYYNHKSKDCNKSFYHFKIEACKIGCAQIDTLVSNLKWTRSTLDLARHFGVPALDVDMHNSTDRHISEQELYCVIDKHGMVQSAVFQWLHLHKIV